MNLSISGDDREKLVDSSPNGYRLEIDKTGVARLVVIQAHGAASVAEKGLANALSTAINRPETVRIGIVAGDPNVMVGQYLGGLIDIDDVATYGQGPVVSVASTLALEVTEQTAKQVFGPPSSFAGHDLAHPFGQAAQDAARSRHGPKPLRLTPLPRRPTAPDPPQRPRSCAI
jgi:hypothetical protein